MANIHPHIEAMLNRYDLKKDDEETNENDINN